MPVIDERQELAKKSDLATKQDILTPGTGITIQNNVISATGSGGSTVTVTPVLSTGTRIAAIEVDGTIHTLFAPTPPSVSVTQIQQSGVELARVTIDNTPYSIYAPEGTVVLSGTSAPSSSLGEDNNLYVQYTVESRNYTVDMTYVKLNGTWVELAASGSEVEANPSGTATDTLSTINIDGTIYDIPGTGTELPPNYNPTPEYLRITSPEQYNELGWGINDDSYYMDSTVTSFTCAGRTWTKEYGIPCLAGGILIHNYDGRGNDWWNTILVSTSPTATDHYIYNIAAYNRQHNVLVYNEHTWYWSGGSGAYQKSGSVMPTFDGIEYIGDFDNFEDAAKWLIDNSGVYFDDYADTFTHVGTPASGVLFAGGGEEADLSDATFKVTAEGDIIGNAFHGATTLANGSVGLVPAPLIADKDKFLKGDGTWVNAGGNVDDVYVNGTSVLDSNKIAQITSYREVTQAEYDALPASKESDNVLYCIKDQATADTTVAPIIYSEEEREVGVWTDGKPLYQKTYTITTDISSSTYDIDSAFVPSVYTLCKSECNYMKMGGGYAGAIFSGETVTNNAAMRVIQSETHGLHCSIDGFGSGYYSDETVITVYYTKAADTPGSGKYAPSGVPAVHYSENEQVVGTWVDGSTLYERTYTGISFEGTSDITIVDANIKSNSGIYNVKSITGLWAIGNFGYLDATIQAFGETGIFNGGSQTLYARVTPNGLAVVRTNTNFGYGALLTVRYTKSTN